MGRPAIGKFTAVRLAPDVLARIDALVAPGRRADFIRGAVIVALDRAEASRATNALARDPQALYAALLARSAGNTKP